MKHDHFFSPVDNTVIMTDNFYFASPGGILKNMFNKIVLIQYLKKLLTQRNEIIKDFAETGKWKQLLR
jgi:ligand-binding SRPBCC domain-containing protein